MVLTLFCNPINPSHPFSTLAHRRLKTRNSTATNKRPTTCTRALCPVLISTMAIEQAQPAALSLETAQAMVPYIEQMAVGFAWINLSGNTIHTNAVFRSQEASANGDLLKDSGFTCQTQPVIGANGENRGQVLYVTATPNPLPQNSDNTNAVLTQILETIPHFVFWKDRNSRFLGCNQNFANTHNAATPAGVIGKSDHDYNSPEKAAQFIAHDQQVMDSGVPQLDHEESRVLPNGQTQWLLTSKVPLRNNQNKVIGILGIYADISELKKAEIEREELHKQLVKASREAGKAEIAAGVLHNVGNVLNSLNVSATCVQNTCKNNASKLLTTIAQTLAVHADDFAGYVQSDPKALHLPHLLQELSEKITSEFQDISDEVVSLKSQLDHVESIVRAQQNYSKTKTLTQTVSCGELIDDAIRVCVPTATQNGIGTVIDVCPNMPTLMTDSHAVLQILVNLINNALHAMHEHPSDTTHQLNIRAQIDKVDETVCFSVQDTGSGIPKENLTQIFQHGFTTRSNGHGFGLHSSANAAQTLGGSLTASSEGRGFGATFTLKLPCLLNTKQDDQKSAA